VTQILHVRRKNPTTGGEDRLELKVVRTWTSPAGTLRLLADGSYVQADGSPPADVGLLNVIADRNQRAAAEAWWRRKGEKLSGRFYQQRHKALAARQRAADAGTSFLETRYFRLPSAGGDREGPFAWAECFPEAPPWWGRVDMTMVDPWVYVREGVNLDPDKALAVVKATAGAPPADDAGEPTDPDNAEPPMDQLTPVVVTVFKSRQAKQPSKRFTGPYQQAMADANAWLSEKDAQEYADARLEVLPLADEAPLAEAPATETVADAPEETI
jgi:hypothetical protein